jgi:NAD(P)-dependent dehydrogenase (short-subunit alcohol dehydrogenase family)
VPCGVTADVVAPGLTDTGMSATICGQAAKDAGATLRSLVSNPMRVLLDPVDIAAGDWVPLLCVQPYITGQVLHVNVGGLMP